LQTRVQGCFEEVEQEAPFNEPSATTVKGGRVARILTPERAARAIYFDFEGCVAEAPSLLGWSFLRDDGTEHFGQGIVARALWGATRTVPQIGGKVRCTQSTLHTEVNCLVTMAEEGDRFIVSWGHHDMDMIERYINDPALLERVRSRYMNALPTARQWLKKVHPQVNLTRTWSGKHRLRRYLEIMDVTVPKKYDQDVAAKGIKATRDAMAKYGSYAKIPLDCGAREAWMAVLGHNRLDCKNAREAVTRAAVEYAAS
jgi:hypothetical protein